MVADMVANKKIKLFMRGIKLKSYFVVPKTIKQDNIFFIMETPDKRKLQQIT